MGAARRSSRARARGQLLEIEPATNVELDASLQFMRVLWVTVHALQKASKRMNRQLGITGPQRLVVRVVGLAPGISAGGLARVLHLHPSTLTGVLKRLEAQLLVSRSPHVGDGRRAVLRLTADGQRLNVAMAGTVEAATRTALRYVTARDQTTVCNVLELVANQLDAPSAARSPTVRRPAAARRKMQRR